MLLEKATDARVRDCASFMKRFAPFVEQVALRVAADRNAAYQRLIKDSGLTREKIGSLKDMASKPHSVAEELVRLYPFGAKK
jgi:uncharacterized FlgJ-related protein